jgi:hypothetical protein
MLNGHVAAEEQCSEERKHTATVKMHISPNRATCGLNLSPSGGTVRNGGQAAVRGHREPCAYARLTHSARSGNTERDVFAAWDRHFFDVRALGAQLAPGVRAADAATPNPRAPAPSSAVTPGQARSAARPSGPAERCVLDGTGHRPAEAVVPVVAGPSRTSSMRSGVSPVRAPGLVRPAPLAIVRSSTPAPKAPSVVASIRAQRRPRTAEGAAHAFQMRCRGCGRLFTTRNPDDMVREPPRFASKTRRSTS